MNGATQLELLIDAQNILGENVLWCERSHRVFWTDIPAQRLHSYSPENGTSRVWSMPERLSCFAFTQDEHILLIGLASRLAFFNLLTDTVSAICDVESDLAMTRVNDGRCDRQGGFVFGTMDERASKEAIGSFYRLHPDLTLERLPLPKIAIANSICFSPDGSAMLFCDSVEKIIYRWDGYARGDTTPIRVFADLSPGSAAPDGAIIDADGFLWSAQWGGARVVRYAPDGSVERMLQLSISQPSCVCLGGARLNQLFVTTAREALTLTQLADQPLAGGLFHTRLDDVHGLPEARFNGLIS
ncbi:SMP-30/gluconolactonase/LRE family protein [Herbaspirillum sp. RTI4]|uniref:SMP-30/gluconolactonase/LRE family protein n=1 Tax=Herbaspirillum sp. RTI4 TaxID=3048640 RepID=UPI002AB4D6E8|nr:SMP-30/gluconolactonase/LRE family protein [Herbaspirillum sp. RTI4]MDY7578754.1 SMP-30/gluconolactonase/LRE family protein [Herbaspirillum sp. RTI4]MEA9982326.1 SMP-30/gluconolactonase/LRE family protein [Herbaspirillum sp. RTI4]